MDKTLRADAEAYLALQAKATPGEWRHRKPDPDSSRATYDQGFVEAPGAHTMGYGQDILGDDNYPTKTADCEFIVAAHNDSPNIITRLLAELGDD